MPRQIHSAASSSSTSPSTRPRLLHPLSLLTSLFLISTASAQSLTLYTGGSTPTATSASAASSAAYTGLAAYDPLTLVPPAPPGTPVTTLNLALPPDSQSVFDSGKQLSIEQKGNFLGFSIELSVANSLMGSSSRNLKVPFLNYMANIQTRAGAGPLIRVGGNSQEDSTIFTDGLEDNAVLDKIKVSAGVTDTPVINYSPELFYLMANVTSLVGAEWFFGLAFNESTVDTPTGNVPIAATYAQQILGSSLRGLSVGNEPDLYVDHNKRAAGYGVTDYVSEFNKMTQSVLSDGSLSNSVAFLGPSVCCDVIGFEMDDVLNAGWLTANVDHLAAVAVQHYPTNNCQINGNVIQAQDIFADFLNHTSAQSLVSPYLGNAATVQAAGKEMIMLETNTASCGGFPGLSDSFGAAMWMTDYALQMAYGNFSAALMHVGGQNVYYNPFTPPPSNQSTTKQWTTGSVYYSTLLISEAFGQSNVSRVVDMTPSTDVDANAIFHPAYAVYENDAPSRVVLFNYIDDATGANDLSTTITLSGATLGATEVYVRYFRAPTVSEQYDITWANQTLGYSFASDGRLAGTQETVTITCTDGSCVVPVKAPSIAIVFMTQDALTASTAKQDVQTEYATSVIGSGSATVDAQALQTSNGDTSQGKGGNTSKGAKSWGMPRIDGKRIVGSVFTASIFSAVLALTI
ncbi:hypothetical protein CI109_102074 [Kwoniella shandongensis]|uniref:Uncharacterized protein n=1 Tax=Kwoniella shandongensis TaxID=1734106 RepID=A0A5M6BQI1_9TREE|nr:uncharacterized protein CI109_006518 [Kwoniella shandongensis]KAA5525148.1 hypothetical protein CI109_006518 [Kwoniella shandongensis]